MKTLINNLAAIFLALAATTLTLAVNLAAQERSDIPGSIVPSATQSGQSGENIIPQYAGATSPRGPDEYGSFSVNGYLGNLGAATRYVLVPYNGLFNQNFDGSLEMWVRPTDFSSTMEMIAKGATANVAFLWGFAASIPGKQYFRIGTTVYLNTDGVAVPLDLWSHVAVTWTGGPSTFTVTFYLNGSQSGTPVTLAATWNLDADSVRIGAGQNWPTEYFRGDIDEVRLWNPERTLAQIRDNRFVGVGDGGAANAGGALTSSSSYTGLISSWTFNTAGTAFDDFGGLHGSYQSGANAFGGAAGQPIPYNFALYCAGGSSADYVTVPDNNVFNQNVNGTFDAWIHPTSTGTTRWMIAKGNSGSNFSFGVALASSDQLAMRIGASAVVNSDGSTIPINKWTHVAVNWTGTSGNYTTTFYVNGLQSGSPAVVAGTWNITSDSLTIGIARAFSGSFPVMGYMDEVRLWDPALTQAEIVRYMFVSGRGLLPNPGLLALWNFDGNLNNFSATAGINGSFNTGGINNCRLSAYRNESSTGAISRSFIAHPTVINRGGSPNPFPGGYTVRAPFIAIPENNPTGISDVMTIANSIGVTNVEVFLSVAHTFVGDLIITLEAPNGQVRTLTNRNGSTGDGILTFFNDLFGTDATSTTYFAPWAFLRPIELMGNFGGASTAGQWTLRVSDNANIDVGVLQGWGIRFNNVTGVEQLSASVPERFELGQNYPNPFNPTTRIEFLLPEQADVSLKVYSILGQEVASLVNGHLDAGHFVQTWDSRSDKGLLLSSGVYFYRLTAKGVSGRTYGDLKKMMSLK